MNLKESSGILLTYIYEFRNQGIDHEFPIIYYSNTIFGFHFFSEGKGFNTSCVQPLLA